MSEQRLAAAVRVVAVFALLLIPAASLAGAVEPHLRRANALEARYRAEAFREMAEPFPSHTITRGGPVSILPRSIRPLDIRFEFRGSTITLDDYLVHTRTTGFLVIKDRTIVAERYFLGADEKSHFTLWSVAKPITSTLVGLAIADGKIKSVDSPVTDYIPELRRSGYEGVPIKDILDMSLGVDFTEDAYDDHPSDVMTMWASDPGRRARTP